MSGRLSVDSAHGSGWGAGGHTPYGADGTPLSASHGRRSSIYRAQNSTLFNAFEEEGMGLSQLPEEEESDDERRGLTSSAMRSSDYPRRSLGADTREGRGREIAGGRHPAYSTLEGDEAH
jgi:hypothetical protein